MKVFRVSLVLLAALPLVCHAYPAADKSLSLEDVSSDLDNEQGESVKESQIAKRSGSFDYVAHLKSGLLSGIGQASASIAGGSSGGSHGGGGDSYKSHEIVVHGNSVDYDPWSFKKSVLNTIFQAVKAITGGVTALKGQLIKGSGYALSAGGNLVAAGGDKVTDVGKSIINSAHINSHTYATSHSSGSSGGLFAKLSSLSGASSGGSSGHKSAPSPVIHTDTITTYEIPSGHASYGPPSKPPTYSSATHQYLPPVGGSYGGSGGGAPFSVSHSAAFEAPSSNYLPSAYGQDADSAHSNDFNIYGRHTKLTDDEARRAANQLQEILNLLPNGKTEYTASKTVDLPTGGSGLEHAEVYNSYGLPLPNTLGTLESLSHTESITAAYGPAVKNPADVYHQMAKRPSGGQTAEELYIQKHPNEGYDYPPPAQAQAPAVAPQPQAVNEYRVENYHATKSNALKDLSPIIAALEVAKRKGNHHQNGPVNYAIEKQVHKELPFNYLPPVVQKSKYVYSAPPPGRYSHSGGYKVRRHAPKHPKRVFRPQDYEIQDPLMFNRLLEV
ncbi:GL23898 [Drosophila persimilis]|uniref:GL23898 n=1 Tax=Drosophila persimilis TaxID=7234 RepID=B4G2F1_DROPE|nr:GL23898 [Drosophila persimilis]